MAPSGLNLFLSLTWTLIPLIGSATTRVSESQDNEASVGFYVMSKTTFAAKTDEFRTIMANSVNMYCINAYEKCGLLSGWNYNRRFQLEDIEVNGVDDSTEKATLRVRYFINLPRNTTVTGTNYVLNKNAIHSSVAASTRDFYDGLGYSIIRVGLQPFSPYPDVTVNAVMITIALLTTFICIGVLLGLQYQNRRQERKAYEAAIAAKQPQTYGKKEQRAKERNRAIAEYKQTHPVRPNTAAKLSPTHSKVSPEKQKAAKVVSEVKPASDPINYPRPYRRGENRHSKDDDKYGHYGSYNSSDHYHLPQHQPTTPQTLNVSSFNQSANSDEAHRDYYNYTTAATLTSPRTLAPLSEDELRKQKKKAKKAKKKQKRLEEESDARLREGSYENGSYTVTEPRYRPPGPDADYYTSPEREVSYRPEYRPAMNTPSAPSYREDSRFKDSTNSDNSDSGTYTRSISSGSALKSTEV